MGEVISGRVTVEEGHSGLNDFAVRNTHRGSLAASSEEWPLGSVDQKEVSKLDSVCCIFYHQIWIDDSKVVLRHACPQLRTDELSSTTTICDSEDR